MFYVKDLEYQIVQYLKPNDLINYYLAFDKSIPPKAVILLQKEMKYMVRLSDGISCYHKCHMGCIVDVTNYRVKDEVKIWRTLCAGCGYEMCNNCTWPCENDCRRTYCDNCQNEYLRACKICEDYLVCKECIKKEQPTKCPWCDNVFNLQEELKKMNS